MSTKSVGKASVWGFYVTRGRTLRARRKPFGLKAALELRVCKRSSVGASLNQNSKWKFRVISRVHSEQVR
jgi:hypothetical protein